MNHRLLPWIFLGLLFITTGVQSATVGQVDDFENGTVMNWAVGIQSPNQPQNIADGGPQGSGDNFLRISSRGGSGPGSRLVVFNNSPNQWAGNYITAGVTGITVDLANLGNTELAIRIALGGPGPAQASTWCVSSIPVTLSPGGQWQNVTFNFTSADLTLSSGSGTLATVLANVDKLRFLSSTGTNFFGDSIVGTLGIDNVTAAVPLPAAVWLFLFGVVTVVGSTRTLRA